MRGALKSTFRFTQPNTSFCSFATFRFADYSFVKIILTENGNFDLALRKRLFCNAKPTLLPCKRAAFGMQNNRFCKVLITSELSERYSCEKYIQFYYSLFVYKYRFYPNAKLRTKRIERMQSVQFKSFQRCVQSFIITNDRIPKQMPSAIE